MVVVLLLAGLDGGVARARPGPPPDPRKGERYDGRRVHGSAKAEAWATTRTVLGMPRWVVHAAVWPAHKLIAYIDEKRLDIRANEAMTSEDGARGVSPNIGYLLSFRPTIGVSLFDRTTLGPGRSWTLDLATGGASVIEIHGRIVATSPMPHLEVLLDHQRRDDQLFTGLTGGGAQARYGINFLDVRGLYQMPLVGGLRVDFGLGLALHGFFPGATIAGNPGVQQVYCLRDPKGNCYDDRVDEAQMPGFNNGTHYVRGGVALAYEGRDSTARPTRGMFAQVRADGTTGIRDGEAVYARVGASLGGAIRLGEAGQVLVLAARADAIAHLGGPPVAFSERLALGGPDDLRGALPGEYRGVSSVLLTAEYRWPIWMWADATLFADGGTVDGPWWSDLSGASLHGDVGFGFRIVTRHSFIFRAQIAYGGPTDGIQTFVSATPGWYR